MEKTFSFFLKIIVIKSNALLKTTKSWITSKLRARLDHLKTSRSNRKDNTMIRGLILTQHMNNSCLLSNQMIKVRSLFLNLIQLIIISLKQVQILMLKLMAPMTNKGQSISVRISNMESKAPFLQQAHHIAKGYKIMKPIL